MNISNNNENVENNQTSNFDTSSDNSSNDNIQNIRTNAIELLYKSRGTYYIQKNNIPNKNLKTNTFLDLLQGYISSGNKQNNKTMKTTCNCCG